MFESYDIIGDVHGHADELEALLHKMGYREKSGCYMHPERNVIFSGDFIDRGPKIKRTLEIVRAMVDRGSALAVMGNHEYNAICYHTKNSNGEFLRRHTTKNTDQHEGTLAQLGDSITEWVEWFKTLPLFLDKDDLRVVHAAWMPD